MPATMLSHIWYKKLLKNLDKIITTTVTLHFWHKYPKIISHTNFTSSSWRYPYLGLVSSNDNLDKKGYPGPPSWGLGVGLTIPPRKTYLLWNFNQSPRMWNKRLWRRWLRNLDLEYGLLKQCSDQGRQQHDIVPHNDKIVMGDINAKITQER